MPRSYKKLIHTGSVFMAGIAALLILAAPAPAQAAEQDPFAFEQSQSLLNLQEETFPEHYDLRNADGRSYVTPVRLQNPFGTCWGFAAIAASESAILADEDLNPDGTQIDADELDLSERHLAYFLQTPLNDPDDPQNGEGRYFKEPVKHSSDLFNTGGHVVFATSLFGSGIGPALESAYPYQGKEGLTDRRKVATEYNEDGTPKTYEYKNVWYSDTDDWTLEESDRFHAAYRMKESYILPTGDGAVDAVKDQIVNHHRAVSVSFHAESFLPGQDATNKIYMSDHWAHYTWRRQMANHAVTIVGYDDNYPASNFLEGHQPPGNGAFLIKNSWGSEMNDFPGNGYRHWGLPEGLDGIPYDAGAVKKSNRSTGYFWLSYYDKSIGSYEAFSFDKANDENGYYVEQYDYVPTSEYGKPEFEGGKMANVFTAEATSQLSGISVMTSTPDTEVTYEVYLLPGAFTDPTEGVLIAGGQVRPQYGGYHRIDLAEKDRPVLAKGQKYSVVVTEKAPESGEYFMLPLGVSKDSSLVDIMGQYDVAIINKGESFSYLDGKWSDVSDAAVQKKLIVDNSNAYNMDNFPIKSYLEPVTAGDEEKVFNGYLEISNWQQGAKGTFTLTPSDKLTLTAEFRGMKADDPDVDTTIKWSTTDENIFTFEEKPGGSDVEITPVSEGTAYLTADAGAYGRSLVAIKVEYLTLKPTFYETNSQVGPTLAYTGKEHKPFLFVGGSDGGKCREGRDYTVSYANNIKCGKATVTVEGKGNYRGTIPLSFTIKPAKAGAAKLKANGKKKTLKVAPKSQKVSGITGYQISYRVKGAAKWKTRTLKVSKKSLTIKNLKKGKNYQIRVRGYVKISGKMVYGDWSKTRAVKIK